MDEHSQHIDSDISLRVEDGADYDPPQFAASGIYSDRQIKEALQCGHIRIYPFEEANLSGT
ncbi:hypothetical protein BRC20_01365, partial [Candidatus Saccharibacteria bacterium QS_8_54_8]